MDQTKRSDDPPQAALRIAERYEILELLGRGGMASVYRARDDATGNLVALKVLTGGAHSEGPVGSVELFEREFHTLVQLAHPRIVRVHDYGVDGEQPYYSMELLDGGDLRELSPLPWQEVCTIAYEICSALSLLHSRGLVHRDLTPRNIRRTASGQAKLIDFGLLSPMGETNLLAGTPPFVAPELLGTMSLDGPSDLFSLGATLYYALTKRQPYAARSFDQLRDAWRSSPLRPSKLVPDIPAALDDLLLGMLRVDPGSRPKSAAEVMDRLLPLLPARPHDELRAARAYLSTPKLVGREQVVSQLRKQMLGAVRGRGGGFVIVGDEGSGRSRILDAVVLEAKLLGAVAVRAGFGDAGRPFGVAASIATQIHRAAPALAISSAAADAKGTAVLYPGVSGMTTTAIADVAQAGVDRAEMQAVLRSWLLAFSSRRPLVIAVDDVDRIDEPSAALLASLSWEAPSRRLVYAAAISDQKAVGNEAAISILRKHAEQITLAPLSEQEVTSLLVSLFGNVPNLPALAARIATLSGGRPRECIRFAQYLVDEGAIEYAGGSFTIPAQIPDGILPASLEQAFVRRVAQLTPIARRVATLLAENLLERLSRQDLLSLQIAPFVALDAAIDELRAAHIVCGDPAGYALSGAGIGRILSASLDDDERRRVHDDLCRIHEHAGRHLLSYVHHGCSGSDPGKWLDRLAAETAASEKRTRVGLSADIELGALRFARAVDSILVSSERFGRSQREQQALWIMLAGASAQGADAAYFYRVRERLLRNLKRDSGHDDWQGLDPMLEPPARAMMAVGAAAQRYAASPEPQHLFAPNEAIPQLVAYVVFAIAVSARVHDIELSASLPELLEPFAPLSPVIAAMLKNARATLLNGLGRREQAYEMNIDLVRELEAISAEQLPYVRNIRAAVCYSLSAAEVLLGTPTAYLSRFASEEDRNQRVSARFLQMLAALVQGDVEVAEAHRRAAELLSLQNKATSMFSTLPQELEIHAAARDLTGVRQVRAAIHELAEQYPGWHPMKHVADAQYLRLCGDLQGAFAATELTERSVGKGKHASAWAWVAKILAVELLTELGRVAEGLALGNEALEECRAHGMGSAARSLALAMAAAEAKLGRFAEALARVEGVIREQKELGITGLYLAQSYEVLAHVAVAQQDKTAFERSLSLAGELYQRAKSSALRARYEKLVDEGRKAGLVETAAPTPMLTTENIPRSTHALTEVFSACASASERADRALALLCDGEPPTRGHLFLFTANGLTLAASNTPCDSVTELAAFAKDCVDREHAADTMETGALHATSVGTMVGDWVDHEGTCYDTVLLGTSVSGAFCIAGIALLVKTPGFAVKTGGALAESVARALIDAGDAMSVAAA
ncbi:MAG TPA: protein kinase [Polyangiaceae bacterium]|nr:protein kinase [Polyangiaceae bacterium]